MGKSGVEETTVRAWAQEPEEEHSAQAQRFERLAASIEKEIRAAVRQNDIQGDGRGSELSRDPAFVRRILLSLPSQRCSCPLPFFSRSLELRPRPRTAPRTEAATRSAFIAGTVRSCLRPYNSTLPSLKAR